MPEILDLPSLGSLVADPMGGLGVGLLLLFSRLVSAALILLLGWVVARMVQAATERTCDRLKVDQAAAKLRLDNLLAEAGIAAQPSRLAARLLYWLLLLAFVPPAVAALGLETATTVVDRLILYAPNVVAAALILVLGLLLARLAGTGVRSAATAGDIAFARQLGLATRGTLTVMVCIVAIEQVGIKTALLQWSAVVAIAAGLFAVALAFALGSREVVEAILAGHYLRKSLRGVQEVSVIGRTGALVQIGPTDTLFRSGSDCWSVPNRQLLREVVDRRGAGGEQ